MWIVVSVFRTFPSQKQTDKQTKQNKKTFMNRNQGNQTTNWHSSRGHSIPSLLKCYSIRFYTIGKGINFVLIDLFLILWHNQKWNHIKKNFVLRIQFTSSLIWYDHIQVEFSSVAGFWLLATISKNKTLLTCAKPLYFSFPVN